MTLFTLFLIAAITPMVIIKLVLSHVRNAGERLTEGLVTIMIMAVLITGFVWAILLLNYIPNNGNCIPTEVIDDTTVIEDSA